MTKYDPADIKFRLDLKVQPRVEFVRTTLHLLDDAEKRIERDLAVAEEKNVSASGTHPDLMLLREQCLSVRQYYLVALPLNIRYAMLVSATAGLEWLVRSMHATHHDDLAGFTENQAQRKKQEGDASAERKFREIAKMVEQEQRIPPMRVVKSLELMAEQANLSKHPDSKVFSDLYIARNAVVHCSGDAKEFKKRDLLREAINRLDGFTLAEGEVDVGGEKFDMPLAEGMALVVAGKQIWIERGALNERVNEALGFIKEVYKTGFGG